MSRRIELAGEHFGAWQVASYFGLNKLGQPSWNCVCACGTEKVVVGQTLRNGKSVSCGCTKAAAIAKAKTKHGHSVPGKMSATYKAWQAMRARCLDGPTHKNWKWYGKHGIKVCKRWDVFANFLADMGVRPEGHSLDRINSHGNYEPQNCRWATPVMQGSNRIPARYRELYKNALESVCMIV